MKIDYVIAILILVDVYQVLAINEELNHLEKNLIYQNLQTQNDLELFYRKILQSNDIDDLKFLKNTIDENDIRNLNIENKVKSKEFRWKKQKDVFSVF
jgi:hypothetical protein